MTPEQLKTRAAELQLAGLPRRALNCWGRLAARADAPEKLRDYAYRMASKISRESDAGLLMTPRAIRNRRSARRLRTLRKVTA